MRQTTISTPDGDARAFVFQPQGQGPWPAVLFFMDGPGIRPTLFEMGERLASHGYYVLLPDMFWRLGPYEPINIAEVMANDEKRREFFAKYIGSTGPEKSMRDAGAFLEWLSKQPEVKGSKVGAIGYCMGATMALRAAGTFPDRVAAAGCFHGSNMATDDPESPHLVAPKIKGKIYVAGGDEDAGFPPAEADRLRDALTAAGVDNTVEIYAGAHHGYAPPDMPAYNKAASERHWREMLALFEETLKGG